MCAQSFTHARICMYVHVVFIRLTVQTLRRVEWQFGNMSKIIFNVFICNSFLLLQCKYTELCNWCVFIIKMCVIKQESVRKGKERTHSGLRKGGNVTNILFRIIESVLTSMLERVIKKLISVRNPHYDIFIFICTRIWKFLSFIKVNL